MKLHIVESKKDIILDGVIYHPDPETGEVLLPKEYITMECKPIATKRQDNTKEQIEPST